MLQLSSLVCIVAVLIGPGLSQEPQYVGFIHPIATSTFPHQPTEEDAIAEQVHTNEILASKDVVCMIDKIYDRLEFTTSTGEFAIGNGRTAAAAAAVGFN